VWSKAIYGERDVRVTVSEIAKVRGVRCTRGHGGTDVFITILSSRFTNVPSPPVFSASTRRSQTNTRVRAPGRVFPARLNQCQLNMRTEVPAHVYYLYIYVRVALPERGCFAKGACATYRIISFCVSAPAHPPEFRPQTRHITKQTVH